MSKQELNDTVVLKVEGLKKLYNDFVAVDDLSLEVKKGEIFGLLGHNGAGKSTTIECILGTKKINSGRISLLGMNPYKDRKKLFQKVGVQLQESNYQSKIKVREICEVTKALYLEPKDYEELLTEFGLYERRNNFVESLSGGEKQKLSVILALIPNPSIIFLDELTTGLDPKARREIWSYLEKLKHKGITIFLTSHYMEEVQYLCDRIAILKKGRVIISDTTENVILKSGCENLEEAYLSYIGEEKLCNEGTKHVI